MNIEWCLHTLWCVSSFQTPLITELWSSWGSKIHRKVEFWSSFCSWDCPVRRMPARLSFAGPGFLKKRIRSEMRVGIKHLESRMGVNYLGVSKHNGTPKASILIGCSIINHPCSGTPYFWKHPFVSIGTAKRATPQGSDFAESGS